eukprot:CAMPEP_0119464724 /NCGR_PEP_ID=MMETSP1344-20130328/195_1 /TAXON_ID=236787 /ORGANISM="Florenciella parvula, Strain CCMP2471" /LENGTH=175 /DNA_ID=CAMNT_0007496953 /DNA_START=45 /DNA_END=573 /DNA_ORIENTATION=-
MPQNHEPQTLHRVNQGHVPAPAWELLCSTPRLAVWGARLSGAEDVAIDIKVPRRFGQVDRGPIHVFSHKNLAPKSRCLGQTKRHVKHIVLVLRGFLGHIKNLGLQDHVARRASHGALACTLQVYMVGVCNLEQAVPNDGPRRPQCLAALLPVQVDPRRVGRHGPATVQSRSRPCS